MVDSREPPNGDFVAYIERMEREQLARAMQPHKLPHLASGGTSVASATTEGKAAALSATEAQRLLQQLKTRTSGGAPRGAMIGVAFGAALIAFGLMAEGGVVLVLLGAVLLWHNLRKLHRAATEPVASPSQQVEHAFGMKSAGAAQSKRGA